MAIFGRYLIRNDGVWKHFKYWLSSSNVLLKHWTYFPKDMLITFATSIMYLIFTLKIFFFFQTLASSSFNKSCSATCNAVSSDCILKRFTTFSSWFVYKYTHLLATKSTCFARVLFKFLVHCGASAWVY